MDRSHFSPKKTVFCAAWNWILIGMDPCGARKLLMTYTLIPGKPHDASEEETMLMIRSVLTEDIQPAPAKKTAFRKAVRQAVSEACDAPAVTDTQPRGRAAAFPALDADTKESATGARKSLAPAEAIARLRGFRPSTRHLAIVSMLLLVVVRPHWFVIGAVLMLAVVIGSFMILGADRIWHGVLKRLRRIEATNPARAARLRTRLDGFAYRWDGFLDLFPDGMVDGLYMPDFQSMEQSDDRHLRAMSERLDRMGQDG
jgi:hypothetical protein